MKWIAYMSKSGKVAMLLTALLFSGLAIATEKSPVALPIDPVTGLIIDKNFELVKAHCTACHSGKLVSQNKMSRQGWLSAIRWMQKTQGLWPLGEAEPIILDYLEAHYHPVDVGRRAPLAKALMPSK
ncbi:hypothetical protein RS130_21930 [Paraglaciecola aquimarina]|uniref:Uncharacterized protein n=1 Tax=Paraglaciecola aquimarina TaxID=1235557 RepID=A0ABU3T1N1_9ALTE|nr:hypothetical protein [Paraglaciecola aquimarina]MDU0356182.1 hypothetical protein [Paraglaciecola aquimarina]